MSLERPLAAAFIDGDEPQYCLGKRLRRFSVWHLFLLQAIDSPLARLGRVTKADLRAAVGICRLRFPRSRLVLPWLNPVQSCRLLTGAGLEAGVVSFLNYAGNYLHKPEYTIIPPATTSTATRHGAPELMMLVADVIGWAHCPFGVVWNLPVGQAYWYQSMARRAAGLDVDFQTERERQIEAEMQAAGLQPT